MRKPAMLFDKKKYIKSGEWEGNEYLVQPDTAVKRCSCCQTYRYSVEFCNLPEVVDGKMPICMFCYRSRNLADVAEGILEGISETRVCNKCEKELPLVEFRSYRKKENKMGNTCRSCVPEMPRYWESESDADEEDLE
jgi:hypothetical protein